MAHPKPDFNEIKIHIRSELRAFEKIGGSFANLKRWLTSYSKRYDEYIGRLNDLERRVMVYKKKNRNKEIIYAVQSRMKEYNSVADKVIRLCFIKQQEHKKKNQRKKIKEPVELINGRNFFNPEKGLADFAGMKILHIKKGVWKKIHEYLEDGILRNSKGITDFELDWKRAYVKAKDKKLYQPHFKDSEIEIRDSGYTSLHYVFRDLNSSHKDLYFECQVRTVFDEGWGEISHEIGYPQAGHSIYTGHLTVLNATTSAANEVTAALEALQGLPTFIPWETEQQLERSAEQVHCLTPSLEWVSNFPKKSFENYSKCFGHVFYYVMPDHNEIDKRISKLKKRLKKLRLDDRVHVEKLKKEDIPYPVVISDILWLHNAVDQKTSQPKDFAVVGGPPPPSGRQEEQLDMLIKDDILLNRLGGYFKMLNNKYFPQFRLFN